MTRVVSSVLELMRATPLVRLRGRTVSKPVAQLWGKLELAMPGQMKDRVALECITDAEARGNLRPPGLIVESSSGTFAEGLARVGTIKGYRVMIVTDPRLDDTSAAKLRALGAELEVVPADSYEPIGGWQAARLRRLREVLQRHPGAFWPRQYDTPSNPAAYTGMADELVDALGDNIIALVAAVGSGGSLCGTAAGIRRRMSRIRIVAVDAVGSVQFNQPNCKRLQTGHGNSIISENINYEIINEVHWLSDAEAFGGCRELARREGIFAGGSSGAVYIVASWVAEHFEPYQHVVAIFPDRGDRYASTIYSDVYLKSHGIDPQNLDASAEPAKIRYGYDIARSWSWSELPHDGSVPYHAAEAKTSFNLTADLGLS
ncbi:MAG: putative siderophore biosynthesis protein SbnA [Syntrophorhabdus sp. PtaU1.Bin002]|nr:MAG: putative siderophore biosynthesis protein SbnA [Syntrophorhabdus sp. PtaU1.Bin002]